MEIGDIHLELDGSFKCFPWPTNYESCLYLSDVVVREGIGLHSGEKTRVRILLMKKKDFMFLSVINLMRFLS